MAAIIVAIAPGCAGDVDELFAATLHVFRMYQDRFRSLTHESKRLPRGRPKCLSVNA